MLNSTLCEDGAMRAWCKRLAMSFIVTLGFATTKLPAQAPVMPTATPADPTQSSQLAAIIGRPPLQVPSAYPRMNARGYCCASDQNWFGCGNWHTQNLFAFGSCRSFFFEPCIAPPPRAARLP
jgi:hypothetical protein